MMAGSHRTGTQDYVCVAAGWTKLSLGKIQLYNVTRVACGPIKPLAACVSASAHQRGSKAVATSLS